VNPLISNSRRLRLALEPTLCAGDWVEVKSKEEILASLDEKGTLEGMPFMPEMLEFYGQHFIPKMPADTEIVPVCRTVGQGRVVDEMIFRFTHDLEMDWMLPGVPPTGRRVEVPLVVVVQLQGDEIVCERIYWDQASVLAQLGLIESSTLPVIGAETARKVQDPSLPSNQLIRERRRR